VANATGTINGATATGVTVTCVTEYYALGGNVSGLTGTVVLQNNGGDDRTITASGAFTFATSLPFGASYLVTIKTQPAGQTCSVGNGTGTMGTSAVADIQVVCAANTFTVGGTLTGLSGTVVLQNNGTNDLAVTSATTFTFTNPVAQGGAYSVTVKTHPDHQACTVSNGAGTNVQANVNTVQVTCTAFDIRDVSTSADLSGGQLHTLAVVNGQLWAWGTNASGQLGNGTTTTVRKPTQIGTIDTWSAVSAGAAHSMGVRQDRTLWTWGNNTFGQLGDGTSIERHEPRQIGASDQWIAISGGLYVSYAIRMDRTLWGWGSDAYRQLGDGSAGTNAPVQVDTAVNWDVIGQSAVSTVGRRTDGTIWGRGLNAQGELGNDSTTPQTTWVQAGAGTLWATVSVGGSRDAAMSSTSHTLALRADGKLFAWGDNSAGQLGNGTTTSSTVPVQIGTSTWLEIAAGHRYSLGIKSDGTLWAWGNNSYGQLGDGSTTSRPTPVQIGTANDWEIVRAGAVRSYAARANDTLWGWGYGADGNLGDNTFTNRPAPVRLLP
jgi:alpha-tubulin suppressor-like RCC1 family protein